MILIAGPCVIESKQLCLQVAFKFDIILPKAHEGNAFDIVNMTLNERNKGLCQLLQNKKLHPEQELCAQKGLKPVKKK